jgi:hypothetical protein
MITRKGEKLGIPFEPPPVSPRNPFRPWDLSHAVAAASRSEPMVAETQESELPELSLSRY